MQCLLGWRRKTLHQDFACSHPAEATGSAAFSLCLLPLYPATLLPGHHHLFPGTALWPPCRADPECWHPNTTHMRGGSMCVRSCGCSHMWRHNQTTNENGESITMSFPANAVLLILLRRRQTLKLLLRLFKVNGHFSQECMHKHLEYNAWLVVACSISVIFQISSLCSWIKWRLFYVGHGNKAVLNNVIAFPVLSMQLVFNLLLKHKDIIAKNDKKMTIFKDPLGMIWGDLGAENQIYYKCLLWLLKVLHK